MADTNNKRIDELAVASSIANQDLFVLQQNGIAKSVTGNILKNFVATKVEEVLPSALNDFNPGLADLIIPVPVNQGGTGQTAVSRAVTVTNDTSVFSNHSVTVRHFPYLGMCFVRGYARLDHKNVAAGEYVTIAKVPSSYAPGSITALIVSGMGDPRARITSTSMESVGSLQVAFSEERTSGYLYDVYFSGWWMVN